MLFDATRHEPLANAPWDEAAARAAIARIVADTRATFTPAGMWPLHPHDAEDGEHEPQMALYFGAAGVIWALDHLGREGAVDGGPTFAEHLDEVQRRNRAALDSPALRAALGTTWQTRSWLLGDAGVLFTRWKTAPSPAVLDALAAVIAANTDDASRELMWGAPGTMLVALALARATGEPRWTELYRAGAHALVAELEHDAALGAEVWTQSLYGSRVAYLGAVHGFAGNAFALFEGRALLGDAWPALVARLTRTIEATALRDLHGRANWPPVAGAQRGKLLVQHCHGAPGIVTALAALDAPNAPNTGDFDELLRGAGELVWTAGPLAKGANLCHGTAGNAFAFLALYARTGDAVWLERARAFAMHAIAQSDAEAAHLGQRRYSLWTGDLGLACFLWECIRGTARFPTMHVL